MWPDDDYFDVDDIKELAGLCKSGCPIYGSDGGGQYYIIKTEYSTESAGAAFST